MLSEDAIDKLVQAIVDRQEAINIWVLKLIAKRIKETGNITPSAINSLVRMVKNGADAKLIAKELAKLTNLQVREIQKLIRTVAADIYADAKVYYDYRNITYVPFEENEELQRIIKSIAKTTTDTYKNISNSTAFMIRDPKNRTILKPMSISDTYQSVLDEAIQASQSGVIDYNTAMRRTLKQLIDSGIRRVEYDPESGRRYTQRLDTAVRRNLNDGIRAINQGVQDEVGRQFGADGKEITVHAMSAPDHEPIQGHQFTNEEYDNLQHELPFKDINGNRFKSIKRAIGIWNCRHFTYSIIVGVTKPNFTQEQLDKFIADNKKGYTDSKGVHYTKYDCTQEQRRMETDIRYAKEGQIIAKEAGDMKLATKYQKKIKDLLEQYTTFSNNCGLKPRYDKADVSGYEPLKPKEYAY